jgi:hypothetical protein
MKSKPILFSTPMIQAILEGRKTQTRRIVKPQPKQELDFFGWELHPKKLQVAFGTGNKVDSFHKFPFGQVGDVLWVRETFGTGKESGKTYYKANAGDFNMLVDKWKPSIFMPKDAARIWLRITNIKIERLQDITEEDAREEGVFKTNAVNEWYYMENVYNTDSPLIAFKRLWQSINGDESWKSNPFVWVIEFERIEKPSVI